jgi:hypothetical protein
MMTLEPISIQQESKQAIQGGHDPFAIIIEPVTDQNHYPPHLEKFLDRRWSQKTGQYDKL